MPHRSDQGKQAGESDQEEQGLPVNLPTLADGAVQEILKAAREATQNARQERLTYQENLERPPSGDVFRYVFLINPRPHQQGRRMPVTGRGGAPAASCHTEGRIRAPIDRRVAAHRGRTRSGRARAAAGPRSSGSRRRWSRWPLDHHPGEHESHVAIGVPGPRARNRAAAKQPGQ
jgi:hypothetical protein